MSFLLFRSLGLRQNIFYAILFFQTTCLAHPTRATTAENAKKLSTPSSVCVLPERLDNVAVIEVSVATLRRFVRRRPRCRRWRQKQAVRAKSHYASWFEAGSKLVADRFEVGRLPVSTQLRTSFEPDSVMEFGREPASSC